MKAIDGINYTQMQKDAKKFGESLDVSDRTRNIAESAYMLGEVFIATKMLDTQKNESFKEIDWEQRRYEIVKEIVIKTIPLYSCPPSQRVETAIEIADTLIEELKKTSK